MKKFFSLLALMLLCSVGAWAGDPVKVTGASNSVITEGWYLVQVGDGQGYSSYHQNYTDKYICGEKNNGWSLRLTDTYSSNLNYVYLTKSGNNYQMNFLYGSDDVWAVGYNCQAKDTNKNLSITPAVESDENDQWKIWGNGNMRWMGWLLDSKPSVGGTITNDNNYNTCYWKLYKVAEEDLPFITVTYNLPEFNGQPAAARFIANEGETASIPAVDFLRDAALVADNTEITRTNNTFTVTGTWNFPIPFNRVTRLHGANHTRWIVYNSATQVDFLNASDNFEKKNYWYFTYAGMKNGKVLVNMYSLANNNPASVANANDGTNVNFNSATPTNFAITANSDGFNICHPDNFSSRFNKYGEQLKFWANGGNDDNENNRFHIKTDVFDTDLANVTTVPGVAGSKFLGEAPFTVDATKKAAAIANPNPENVKALFEVNFADVVDLNKYYRFQCQATDRSHNYLYSDIHANTNGVVDDASSAHRLIVSKEDAAVVNTLFKFEKEGDAYYIQHVNSGKYVTGATGGVDLPFAKSSASTYEPTQVEGKWWGLKKSGTNIHLHQSNSSDGHLLVWGALNQEPASNWTIEEVETLPLTIKASKWASVCFPVAVTLPEQLTAYYAVKVSTDGIGLDALEGNVIPANTPVVVTTSEELTEAKTYNLTIGGTATAPENNLFTGTTIVRQGYDHANAYNYGLSNGKFVRMSGTTVAANKAFIHAEEDLAPAAASTLRVYVVDNTITGIETVETPAEQGAYYDLNGRMVAYPTTGVYVRNGKKIFVK